MSGSLVYRLYHKKMSAQLESVCMFSDVHESVCLFFCKDSLHLFVLCVCICMQEVLELRHQTVCTHMKKWVKAKFTKNIT
jgi:hypothetical protein